jgi:uncharacterized GH25 family protein
MWTRLPRCLALRLAALAALVAGSTPAAAHDLWIWPGSWSPEIGRVLFLDLITGMSLPVSENALEPARIRSTRLVGPRGPALLGAPRVVGKVLRYEVPPTAAGLYCAGVETGPRFIRLKGDEFEAYLIEEGILGVSEERKKLGESEVEGRELYTKYAKILLRAGGEGVAAGTQDDRLCCQPLGHRIEIVPDTDPTRLAPGAELGIQVLYEGRPAPGLQVRSAVQGDERPKRVAVTDADGRARIALEQPGPWALMAIRMERRKDRAQADWESHWASLTFSVPGSAPAATASPATPAPAATLDPAAVPAPAR